MNSDKDSRFYCILNCVEDAKSFLSEFEGEHRQWDLFSTHDGVGDFLSSRNVECTNLTSFITNAFLVRTFKEIEEPFDQLTCHLDRSVSKKVSETLGISAPACFDSLYAYIGKLKLLGLLKVNQALENLLGQNVPKKFLVYHSANTEFLDGSDAIVELVKMHSKKLGFDVVLKENTIDYVPVSFGKKISPYWTNPVQLDKGKKTIILLGYLYDLNFLKNQLPAIYNTILWPQLGYPGNLPSTRNADENLFDQLRSTISSLQTKSLMPDNDFGLNFWLLMVARSMIGDFLRHLEDYLVPLLVLNDFKSKHPIHLGIWGNPPHSGSKALLANFLMINGIPVIGSQHGGNYGTQNCYSIHFDTDFSRCTHFLSYRFTEKDLKSTYPNRTTNCEIIPVGSFMEERRVRSPAKRKPKVDLLFPLTNAMSIFNEGCRPKSDGLTSCQIKLLERLNQFTDIRVVIKPFKNSSSSNCSVLQVISKLKNIEIINDVDLTDYLEKNEVRAMVSEYPSSPMFEVLGMNTEIFQLSAPNIPFSKEVIALLEKRVHWFEDVDSLLNILELWAKDNLPPKRDMSFYNRFLYKENTEDLILKTIERCLFQNHKRN